MIVLSCRCPDRLMNFKAGGLQCALSAALAWEAFGNKKKRSHTIIM